MIYKKWRIFFFNPTLQFVLSDDSGDGIGGVLINTDLTSFLPQTEILRKKKLKSIL